MLQKIKEWFLEGIVKSLMEGKPNIRFRIAMGEINAFFRKEEEKSMEAKKWYSSKTLWINALTVLAGGLTFLMSPDAKLDAQQVGTAGSVLAAVNMVLRFITTKPIEQGGK